MLWPGVEKDKITIVKMRMSTLSYRNRKDKLSRFTKTGMRITSMMRDCMIYLKGTYKSKRRQDRCREI
jgi:hypothetical protein